MGIFYKKMVEMRDGSSLVMGAPGDHGRYGRGECVSRAGHHRHRRGDVESCAGALPPVVERLSKNIAGILIEAGIGKGRIILDGAAARPGEVTIAGITKRSAGLIAAVIEYAGAFIGEHIGWFGHFRRHAVWEAER